jgi:hypothetical protein
MKQQICILLLLLGLSSPVLGQVDSAVVAPETQTAKHSFIFRSGFLLNSLEFTFLPNMNNYLEKRKLNDARPGSAERLVLDFGIRYKDWFFTGNGSTTITTSSSSNTSKSVALWLERTFRKDHNFRINLYSGVSYYQNSIIIRNTKQYRGQSVSINNLPATTFAISPDIVLSGPATDIGIVVMRRERSQSNFDYAIRVGYRHAWRSRAWRFEDRNVTLLDAPQDRFSAFYMHTTIGISSRRFVPFNGF